MLVADGAWGSSFEDAIAFAIAALSTTGPLAQVVGAAATVLRRR